jgi:toxin ParE1/3/4
MPAIIKRPKAKTDLAEIWDYIADDSEMRADGFIQRIDKTLLTIAQTPSIGRSRKELAESLRSLPLGRYVIFYCIITGGIEIVRVLHSSRDINANFFADDE